MLSVCFHLICNVYLLDLRQLGLTSRMRKATLDDVKERCNLLTMIMFLLMFSGVSSKEKERAKEL